MAIIGAVCLSPGNAAAQTFSGGFGAPVSSVRLIAAKNKIDGRYQAAIEITMKQGSHTYWRAPGDAGVPPVFAFEGSSNVMKSDVLFPVPSRITEAGLEAFGYKDHVLLPLLISPTDPTSPSLVHVAIDYAVCNTICIPAKAKADLQLPVADGADEAVATAFASVPVPLPADQIDALSLAPIAASAKPSWILGWRGTARIDDIFAEGPEGFAFDTRHTAAQQWTLTASQIITDPGVKSVAVTLTIAGPDQHFVTTRTVNLGTTSR